MGLPDGRKSFKIGLAVLIQYRRVTDRQTDTQPATQPRCRSKYRAYIYVVRVKIRWTQRLAIWVLGLFVRVSWH